MAMCRHTLNVKWSPPARSCLLTVTFCLFACKRRFMALLLVLASPTAKAALLG